MDIPAASGLRGYLRGTVSLEEALQGTQKANLWLLPSGPDRYEVSRLDTTARFRELLALLREMFDVVVVDLPPILLDEKSPALVSHMNGVVLVVESGTTTSEELSKAAGLCSPVPVKGLFLNKTQHAAPEWLTSLLRS
jgi:Mrp family chromosome partitioning ATPase